MDIVDRHQQEGVLLLDDVNLGGCRHQGHLPPGVGEVGGAFWVVREQEVEDVRVGGNVLRKGLTHGYRGQQ